MSKKLRQIYQLLKLRRRRRIFKNLIRRRLPPKSHPKFLLICRISCIPSVRSMPQQNSLRAQRWCKPITRRYPNNPSLRLPSRLNPKPLKSRPHLSRVRLPIVRAETSLRQEKQARMWPQPEMSQWPLLEREEMRLQRGPPPSLQLQHLRGPLLNPLQRRRHLRVKLPRKILQRSL